MFTHSVVQTVSTGTWLFYQLMSFISFACSFSKLYLHCMNGWAFIYYREGRFFGLESTIIENSSLNSSEAASDPVACQNYSFSSGLMKRL